MVYESYRKKMNSQLSEMPSRLLYWYKANARDLPWRIPTQDRERGINPDPYHVWLSEIMLQQTTVKHALPYYHNFIQRWPTVNDLAAASDDDVLSNWAGLGYYARARNLLKCARAIALEGKFPDDPTELTKFPGIGDYTSKAIASIAFGKRYVAIDTNAERVFSRLLAIKQEWKVAKQIIKESASELVPSALPSEFSQGLMDLGATICTPKRPQCTICPIQKFCSANIEGNAELYPRKPPKTTRPARFGAVFFLVDGNEVLLERRSESGLLGGMLGFPTTSWINREDYLNGDHLNLFPYADWQYTGEVKHVFTHFSLTLAIYTGYLRGERPEGIWTPLGEVSGLPTLFKKVYQTVRRETKSVV